VLPSGVNYRRGGLTNGYRGTVMFFFFFFGWGCKMFGQRGNDTGMELGSRE
jgi:hypothetical protein